MTEVRAVEPAIEPAPTQAEVYDVFLAMRKRRMHREFLPDQVDEPLLERLIYAAGRGPAPRAGIRHLVVTTDPRLIRSIRQVCPGWLNNAPAMMAVCTDTGAAEDVMGASAEKGTAIDSGRPRPMCRWRLPRSGSESALSPAGRRRPCRACWIFRSTSAPTSS